jgi:arginine decarboxylase
MKFTQDAEYSWHTPGHQGGIAFLKSPVGRMSSSTSMARTCCGSDLSISVGSLGSLLDHTGPSASTRNTRARVRRTPHLLRHQRHVHVEPRDLHGGRGRDQIALCDRTATSRSSTAW